MLEVLRLYAIPLAAVGLLAAAVGFLGHRSTLAAAWSLAVAIALVGTAITVGDMFLAGARVALWTESGLMMAAAYAAGFSLGAGARALLPASGEARVTPGQAAASPRPGPRSA